jgi:hypothetical protein
MKDVRSVWKKEWIRQRDEGALLRGVVKHVAVEREGNQWGYLSFGNPADWAVVLPQ